MDLEEILKEITETVLNHLGTEYDRVSIIEEENNEFLIKIDSENPSLLIGYHGENMLALQHVIKVLAWKRCPDQNFNILLDVDEYRQRQEENVLSFAKRKIEAVRTSGRPQSLPPMSAYFRRKVHLHCMEPGNEDIETFSDGDGEQRHIVIKLKS